MEHLAFLPPVLIQKLLNEDGTVNESIRPYYQITDLTLEYSPSDPFSVDLRYLSLFPNTTSLSIRYGTTNIPDDISSDLPLCLSGIENCTRLKGLIIHTGRNLTHLRGIEYCGFLEFLMISPVGDPSHREALDISSLSELGNLITVEIGSAIQVETEGLDLSGCKKLRNLSMSPKGRTLEFLRENLLSHLTVCQSDIDSLKFLRIDRLRYLNISHTKIESLGAFESDRLVFLDISGTPIKSLERFDAPCLRSMAASNCEIRSLKPLYGLNYLTEAVFYRISLDEPNELEHIRAMIEENKERIL